MYQKTFYATHPESIYGATNEELRELYLVSDIFVAGKLKLNYSHFDRIAVGGAVPTGEKLSLPVFDEPESAENPAKFYLLSTLAHKRFETKLLTAKDANKLHPGSVETSNVRTVYQMIIPGVCESSAFIRG